MSAEEDIKKELCDKFGISRDGIVIKRARRIFASIPDADFMRVFDHAVKNMNFYALCTITGLDDGDNITAIYHLADARGITLNLKRSVAKTSPVFDTVSNYFSSAILYEREMVDLLGVIVNGLPEGRNYPLPEGWPKGQHPLRKDWNPDMLQTKGGEG